jgi:hypothetical protein
MKNQNPYKLPTSKPRWGLWNFLEPNHLISTPGGQNDLIFWPNPTCYLCWPTVLKSLTSLDQVLRSDGFYFIGSAQLKLPDFKNNFIRNPTTSPVDLIPEYWKIKILINYPNQISLNKTILSQHLVVRIQKFKCRWSTLVMGRSRSKNEVNWSTFIFYIFPYGEDWNMQEPKAPRITSFFDRTLPMTCADPLRLNFWPRLTRSWDPVVFLSLEVLS